MSDLKFAFRQLVRSPGFTAIAVLTLALGIGFSTSSFSIANALLLRDVPYPGADRLVRIFRTSRQSTALPHAPANLLDIREAVTSFSGTAIFNRDSYALGEPGQPAEQVVGMAATAGFLEVLGVKPALGRGFAPGDDQPGRPAIALLAHGTWVLRYGADPGVLGRSVRLNGTPHTIVGVLPPAFDAPLVWGSVEFVTPETIEPAYRTRRTGGFMQCVARLRPGVSLGQAQSELHTIAARLARQYPTENAGADLRVALLHDSNIPDTSRTMVWLVTGVSLTMLLIACANLAGLQMARALRHSHDHAVRAALGGGRGQLMRPLIVESLVLALAGGVLGMLIASWANEWFSDLLQLGSIRGVAIPVDGTVLGFACLTSVASGIAFGLAPAWLSARASAVDSLKEATRTSTPNRAQRRLKRLLIAGQLALALALVGATASFGLGFRSFLHRPVGWQPRGLFAATFVMSQARHPDEAGQREFHRALLARLATIPGVEHATLAQALPLYSLDLMARTGGLIAEGQPLPEAGRETLVEADVVSPDFFATLQIPFRRGGGFAPGLKADDPPVAIVNRSLAERFWPGQDPIGRRVRFAAANPLRDPGQWIQVVGVVEDVRMLIRFDVPETRLQIFRPLVQAPNRYLFMALRTSRLPESLIPAVRQAVAALDPDLPVANTGSLLTSVDRYLSNFNAVALNLTISAGMGLLIAGVGLFGTISQMVAQRTREFGVRIALGARPADILGMVFGEGARLLTAGIIGGGAVLLALNRAVAGALPEVRLPGGGLLTVIIAIAAIVMLLACWLPAGRATRINPVEALRSE